MVVKGFFLKNRKSFNKKADRAYEDAASKPAGLPAASLQQSARACSSGARAPSSFAGTAEAFIKLRLSRSFSGSRKKILRFRGFFSLFPLHKQRFDTLT
ncbi:MAG: hypothetical protein IJS90_04775 [Clostridia bacterium]|nr:hypothetical protein [Clostridia bacterium]